MTALVLALTLLPAPELELDHRGPTVWGGVTLGLGVGVLGLAGIWRATDYAASPELAGMAVAGGLLATAGVVSIVVGAVRRKRLERAGRVAFTFSGMRF